MGTTRRNQTLLLAIEVWHPEDDRPEVVAEVLRWRAAPGADALEIEIPTLFQHLPD